MVAILGGQPRPSRPRNAAAPPARIHRQLHLDARRRGWALRGGGSGRGGAGARGGDRDGDAAAHPSPRRPYRRRRGTAAALARHAGVRAGGRSHRPALHPRRRRRCRRGRALALRCDRSAGTHPQPRRLHRPWRPVLRRHPVQPRLRPPVRGQPGADARLARPAGGAAGGDAGVLRARIHPGQRRLRGRGRTRQPGPAPAHRGGHRDTRSWNAHPAKHPRRGTRHQPVPAGGRARGAGRGRGAARPRAGRPGRDVRRTAALERRVPRMRRAHACLLLALLPFAAAAQAPQVAATAPVDTAGAAETAEAAMPPDATPALVPTTRSGREIYRRFREGLADPVCEPGSSSPRWRKHFAAAPVRLADADDDVLALFGYVVDAQREPSLPTEYALIPFVESGYKPAARSRQGPAGMRQMIRLTARAHHVPMHRGYDGRLSPVESTRAAVRYLKTLHGMFAGDWRLAVMAYNAGEYRVFGALRRAGQVARDADPEKLTSLSGITRAYVRKLHALSCLFDRADDGGDWLQSLDRQVPLLEPVELPAEV